MLIFLKAFWQIGNGGKIKLAFETHLGLAEIDSLFDTSDPLSLGSSIINQQEVIAEFYECQNLKNCSDYELAYMQWGESYVTHNPVYTSESSNHSLSYL